MAKQLNVSLAFSADTSAAKQQLQQLQTQLNNILKTPSGKLNLTEDIKEAIQATAELSAQLSQATNVNTGNLDFSKFNRSLKQSGQSLQSYGQQLQRLGPQGQQAFLTLTKSIAMAEIPMKRTNKLVQEFSTSLANTARWQISSSVLHGFMGAMQSAYGYAQDLNESLNNIRIVTGQSIDQMAAFAEQANKAAKALSATTTEYTNASLIYYQQGLSDQEVQKRTDITIKMANAAGQSAEMVSDQLTAVWNNFYDGTKSLEYYADVMTALGAATASSTDEIAGGLEKFAAIGETIGLSYEYAASALATITSNTRQSEEVVGTALKTIFARIQGLKLGETLDDGVNLNKYSEALQAVGISILDSTGQLKQMDTILEEMAGKWDTMSNAQQTALAQTVAGVRQYTQLVALMENWDNGDNDSMKANLTTSYNATGALQEQADIYAESWEAAQDRVTAAAEGIYDSLLNDEFFIDILNNFEKILTFVNDLIENLGGLEGVFLALGTIVTKVFSKQISQGLTNMAYNLKMSTKAGRAAIEQERQDYIDNAVKAIPQSNEYTTEVEKAQQDSLRTELTLQSEYMQNSEKMSSLEAEANKHLIERTRLLKEHTVELAKQKQTTQEKIDKNVMTLRADLAAQNLRSKESGEAPLDYQKEIQPEINNIKSAAAVQAELKDLNTTIDLLSNNSEEGAKSLQHIKTAIQSLDTSADEDIARLVQEINKMGDSPDPEQLRQKLEALNIELEKSIKISVDNIKDVVSPEAGKKVDALTQDLREQAEVTREVRIATESATQAQEAASGSISKTKGAQKQWSDIMVESANVAFNVATAFSMVSSAIETLKDPNISGMEKLLTVITTMSMVLPTIISLIGTLKKLFSAETVEKIANAAATWAQVKAERKLNKEKDDGITTTRRNIKHTRQNTRQKWNETALANNKNFEKLDNGNYHKVGDPDTLTYTPEAAQQAAGAEAGKALGSKIGSGIIAAIGIAIIIGTISTVIDQLKKAEKNVDKAKKAAQELSARYDEAKEAHDSFMSSLSTYENETKGLENLTKGTDEYREALLRANDAASALLQANKDLKYEIIDGQIIIDEESLKAAQTKQVEQLEYAQAAKMAGQAEIDKAEYELNKRDMARTLKSDADKSQKGVNALAGGVLGGLGAGLAAGGTAGLIAGSMTGPGAIITGVVGAAIGAITGVVTAAVQETSTEAEQKALDILAEKAEQDDTFLERLEAGEVTDDELKTLGIDDAALIDSLQENGKEVAALVTEMQANTAALNAQNDLVASQALADNKKVQDSDFKDEIIDITGDAYGLAYEKAMNSDWVDTWGKEGIAKINGANAKAKEVFSEYLKYAGLEGQNLTLTDTTGTDNNREFVYKDAQGNEYSVTLEAMQAARAAYEASQTLDETANKLAETFNKLSKSTEAADQALLSFASKKDFSKATKGEFDDMRNKLGNLPKINGKYDVTAEALTKSYLEKEILGGEELTNDVAIEYGYKSADAMIKGFLKEMDESAEAWDSISLPSNFKFSKDLSLETAQALENQIKDMNLGPLGESAGITYVDGLNKALDGIDSKKQQEALDALSKVDWSQWDAMEQAEKILKDLEIDIDTSSEAWVTFTEKMRLANGAIPDFSQVKNDLQEISTILNKLEFGGTIDEEDYQRILDYKKEWEEFFILQADGSRKFIGDSKEMSQATRDNIQLQREELAIRQAIADTIDEKDKNNPNFDLDVASYDKILADFGGDNGIIEDDEATANGYANSEDLINKVMAQRATTLVSDEDVKKLLEQGGYSPEITAEIIKEALNGNRDRLEKMLEYVDNFMSEDFSQSKEDLDEMMASTATDLADLNQLYQEGSISAEAYGKQAQYLTYSNMAAAESLSALQTAWQQGYDQTGAELDYEVYADNLLRLAENYEICTEEATAFQNALKSGSEAAIKDAEEVLEASIMLGEAAEKYGMEVKELSIQSKALSKEYKINEKAAAQLAIENQRMNVGVANMVNNWEDWRKELVKSDHTSRDWAYAAAECTTAIADLVGASQDLELPESFFESTENMLLLEQAAKGSEEAISKLGIAVTRAQIEMMEFQDGMTDIDGNLINASEFNGWKNTVLSGIDDLQFALDNVSVGDNVYEKLGGDQWVSALNEMAIATNMSVEQMNSMLNSMGVQAEVTTTDVPQKIKVPVYTTTEDVTTSEKDGVTTYTKVSRTVQTGTEEMDGVVSVAQINTGDDVGSKPKITYIGNGNVSSSAKEGKTSPGDSGKKTTDADKTKKSDVVERYKEINDQLADVQREASRAEESLNRLYGDEQNAAIQDLIQAQEKEKQLLQEQQAMAHAYLAEDMLALETAAAKAGVLFTFDENGNIANYTSQMTKLYNELALAEAAAGEEWTESEQEQIDAIKEKIDAVEEAQQAYESTLDTIKDVNKELDKFKGKPPLPVVTSDLVDIYKEVNDELDDIEDSIDRIDKKADRLTGSEKVKYLRDSARIEKEKLATLQAQAEVNKKDIAETQAALLKRGADNGLTFTFDENGNISNYNEQLQVLINNYKEVYAQLAADGGISDADQAILDAISADIDELEGLATAYSNAVEEGEEILKQKEEAFYAWQDKNFEALSYDLEIRIDVDEDKLELVDYYLSKMDGDVFSMGESLALMTGDKMNALLSQTATYQQQYLELQQAYQNGEISQEDYFAGLDEIKDGLMSTAQAMQELDQQTIEYYGNTLTAAQEEIDKYVESMDHLSNVLEHYQTILDLSTLEKGSEEYFKNMDTVLEGQLATAENAVEVAKATMDMFKSELVAKEAAYQQALQSGDAETIKIRQEQYEAALKAANAAEEEYLTRVEEYAQKTTEILEHNLEKLANTLEDKLTGGTSFDQMNTGMERMVSLHEEYLTTTNKVYETQKLMRSAQQEIDKTSNTVAKNKMRQFIKETQNLQDQNKLSQFELDIQQAKYDLLVAEIALEEAQNAKSQVRLQRDSEGNFGYVYTADQEMVQNAEQEFLDAQNELYNIGLEGANGYVQKYQQTMAEMYDTLTSLAQAYRDGEFESEAEYHAAVEEATQYYYEKLDQYSYLHYQAIQTDDRVATDYILSNSNLARTGIHGDTLSVGDSWRTAFLDISGFGEAAQMALTGQSWEVYDSNREDLENMTENAESWKEAVVDYVGQVDIAFTQWKDNIAQNVSPAVENLEGKVSAVVTASENFAEALTGDDGVIKQLEEEIRQVGILTDKYIALRQSILDSISAAEQAIQTIMAEKAATVDPPETADPPKTTDPPVTNPPTTNPTPTSPTPTDPGNSGSTQGDGTPQVGDVVTYVKDPYYYDSYGKRPLGMRGQGKQATITKLAPGNPYPIHLKSNDSAYGWVQKDQITGYDTGGYTGDWNGPEGKFAMLHKKELVLNRGDTENFLASMEVLEKILSIIDLQSANQLCSREMSSPKFSSIESDVLEQNVSIEANFPNVSDRNEIEEAFKDLVNLASQYANRK